MAESENAPTRTITDDVQVNVYLAPPVYDAMLVLLNTGLFGRDMQEVVERLACRSLIDLTQEGWLSLPGEEDEEDSDDTDS